MCKLRSNIKSSFQPKAKAPHVLIELSQKEFKRHQDNSILVEKPYIIGGEKEMYYKTITFGNNVRFKLYSSQINGMKVKTKTIHIQKMKRQCLFIIANKNECQSLIPNVFVSQSTTNTNPSGKVILMACMFDCGTSNCTPWQPSDFTFVKSCKPNIISGSSHHESLGYYASFGNKGSYSKVIDSSVGQYVSKTNKDPSKQKTIDEMASKYEKRIVKEIDRCVTNMERYLPNIQTIISPVIDTAYEIQSEVGDINLQPMSSSKSGYWQYSICINAQTQQFHNENDCTYTIINVPHQDYFKTSTKKPNYKFIFKLSNMDMVNIELYPTMSFIFSGLFLTHRQNKKNDNISSNDVFFNIASYGNKRLFNHLRKSINNK